MQNISQFYHRILNQINQIIYQNKYINKSKKENNPVHGTGYHTSYIHTYMDIYRKTRIEYSRLNYTRHSLSLLFVTDSFFLTFFFTSILSILIIVHMLIFYFSFSAHKSFIGTSFFSSFWHKNMHELILYICNIMKNLKQKHMWRVYLPLCEGVSLLLCR
jgi:hypothetical protein